MTHPLQLGWRVRHGKTASSGEDGEDVCGRDAKFMQDTTSNKTSATDARPAVDGNRYTTAQLRDEAPNKCRRGRRRLWDAAVWNGKRHELNSVSFA